MVATMNWLLILAAEGHGIPGSDWRAQVAVPIGVILFIGSVYMLVRSNLGTRRGYLVTATSLFGFMIIYAAFWTFGAPGTPPATGPQNLPGQELDAYEDVWRPFAGDSTLADDPAYEVVKTHPEGWATTPEEAGLPANIKGQADTGSDDIKTFFSTPAGPLTAPPIAGTWAEVERHYAKAANGRALIAVSYKPTYQVGQLPPGTELAEGEAPPLTPDGEAVADDESNIAPEGTEIGAPVEDAEPYKAFAYFDPGSPMFPSLVTLAIMIVLFILHALLLAADERKERREREAASVQPVAEERVPAEAGRS